MATVTVLKFPTTEGANKALDWIQDCQKHPMMMRHGGALVSWPAGKKSPKMKQLVPLVDLGATSSMFWGMLLGFIFATPLFGIAFGGRAEPFRGYGIADDLIQWVRGQVTEGTSALFLIESETTMDEVAEELKSMSIEIMATNLSKEQEQRLLETFGH
jgi:uncharacterized membrane protein